LSTALVYAIETSKMGHQDLVHGMLYHQICMDFAVYCGKEEGREDLPHVGRGKAKLAQKVVLDLA
jgi:hypothetical protein